VYHRVYYRRVQNLQVLLCLLRQLFLGYEEGMESIRNPVRKLNHCNWISRHCLRVYNIYFRFPCVFIVHKEYQIAIVFFSRYTWLLGNKNRL